MTDTTNNQQPGFSTILSDLETRAGAGATGLIDDDVAGVWLDRVRASGVCDDIAEWRTADRVREGKGPGGRKPEVPDDVTIVLGLLLALEGSKVQPHEMGRLLEFRLTDAAKQRLGITHLYDGKPRDYMHLAWRAVHRAIDTFDGWPAKRRTLSLKERIEIEAKRDPERVAEMRARGERFTSALIEMGLALIPAEYQHTDLALSVDQSAIRAGSQRRRWSRDDDGVEVPKWNKHTGEEMKKHVLELEADLYPVKKGVKYKTVAEAESNGVFQVFEMSFMANLIIDVAPEPESDRTAYPLQLIRAASLGTPNKRVGEHTLALLDLILERGHTISRLTFDRGYNYLTGFHEGLRARGIEKVQDYMPNQRGVTNGLGGAKFVEGRWYCNGTPKELLEATEDFETHKTIDEQTYWKRIKEREKYELHVKEGADHNGTVKLRCPALGKAPTLECPIRELHKDATTKKDRAVVLKRNTQAGKGDLPRVCCQSSLSFKDDLNVQTRQKFRYGSKEWYATYRADRNSIESANHFLKRVLNMEDTSRRGMRGLAAQQFILAIHVVAANHKRITDYVKSERKLQERIDAGRGPILRKAASERLIRRRDRLGLSNYKRRPAPQEPMDRPDGAELS